MRSRLNVGPICRRLPLALAVAAVSLTSSGCGGSGPLMAQVTCTVTYQGKAVPKGTISFVSTDPARRNATGQLDQQGSYRLQTEQPGDGAELGDYTVTLYSHDEPVLDYMPKTPVKVERRIPEKYEKPDTSGLKKTVKSGSNTINLELTD